MLTQELERAKEQIEWLTRQLFERKNERMEFAPNQLLRNSILIDVNENAQSPEPAFEIESSET